MKRKRADRLDWSRVTKSRFAMIFVEAGAFTGYATLFYIILLTASYFAHPTEIRPLLEQEGFEILCLQGCEGIIAGMEEQVNFLTCEFWQAWVDLNYRFGKDPSVYGTADHLLAIGRKRPA